MNYRFLGNFILEVRGSYRVVCVREGMTTFMTAQNIQLFSLRIKFHSVI
jgi:hypothetical protein